MVMFVSLKTFVPCSSSENPQESDWVTTGKCVSQHKKMPWFPLTQEKVSKRNFKMLALVI